MGQKTSPIGFRLALNKKWKSLWYADKRGFGNFLGEDKEIRSYLMSKPICVATSLIEIKRVSGKLEVTIHTARPGMVIGKKGADIEVLKQELRKLTNQEVWVEVEEVKRPDLDAKLVADWIAQQLKRRVPYRRVMKKAIRVAMDAGASGIRVLISGRLGGADIARSEFYKDGSISLHTLKVPIDFAQGRAETAYGSVGVKVWIKLEGKV